MNEPHVALYRKYRPQNFEEVIGQDHIVKAIKGALDAGKIGHAYLLCGPRGTGKTTIARIIARELGTSPNDIYELDGASNRKIEDAREIRDNIRTLPFDSKYKVYILDEVHMFTKEAWNALLKTIEEPPEYVVFILATTEIEKVPETIISRCQTFIFKKPSENVLENVVESIVKREEYSIEKGGAELLALLGDGSFRDTLSILDQVMAFTDGKKITTEGIRTVAGAPERSLVEAFISSLSEKDFDMGYKAIRTAGEQNIDMKIYLKMILATLRYALMFRYAPKMKTELAGILPDHDVEFISDLIAKKPTHISSRSLTVLLETYQSMRFAFIPELPLELALTEILDGTDA